MNKYRIYCTECEDYKYIISEAIPTICPVNPAHTLNAGSAVISEADILVNDGSPTELSLGNYKELRYNEIDAKTDALISEGFTFDGQVFGTSVFAQINWNTLKNQKVQFNFPLDITTKDHNTYTISEANVDNFWNTGKDFVKGHLDSGRALKKSVYDAVDEAGVDAVVDSR